MYNHLLNFTNSTSDSLRVFWRCFQVHDHNARRLVRKKMLSIFKPSFRTVIGSGAEGSRDGIFGGNNAVIDRLTERKKVDQALRGAVLPTKNASKGKNKSSASKKGSGKNKPAAQGSKKGKKPRKRQPKAKASDKDSTAGTSDNQGGTSQPCKSEAGPDPDCFQSLDCCQGCGKMFDKRLSDIPRDADWPVNFPLQSAVEYVAATGLQPETSLQAKGETGRQTFAQWR